MFNFLSNCRRNVYPFPIFNWVIFLFIIELYEFFVYSRYRSFIRYMICKIFLPSRGCLHFLDINPLKHKNFQFDEMQDYPFFLFSFKIDFREREE